MELRDNKMKELLSYSKLELPFADFEENMLQKIQEFELKKKAAEKYKFFSHVCFLAGIILGFLINFLMSKKLNEFIPNSDMQEMLNSGIQLVYVVMVVLFGVKLWYLSKMNLRDIFK